LVFIPREIEPYARFLAEGTSSATWVLLRAKWHVSGDFARKHLESLCPPGFHADDESMASNARSCALGICLLVVAAMLSACAADTIKDLTPGPCSDTASPLSAEEVRAALREKGFLVEPDGMGCGGSRDTQVVLTNLDPSGGDDHDEIKESQGVLFCAVTRRPRGNIRHDRVHVDDFEGDFLMHARTFVDYQNVECQLFAAKGRKGEQINRLRHALAGLVVPHA
jgi:hypothetical protein